MTGSERRIVIAVQPDRPSPSGHVELADQEDQPFTGWLGLLSVLGAAFEQLREGAAPRTDDGSAIAS